MSGSEQLRSKFEQPSVEYRSAPFWAWNDDLQEEELVRQIEQMKEQGMGGFFIHSRDGLETDYMGREWMDYVRTAVQTAERLGMQAWLYDEDRWPSGFAGGLVQASGGDANRAKGLTMEVCHPGDSWNIADAAALFKAIIDERSLIRCERLPINEAPKLEKDEVLLVFRVEVSEYSEWFNNEAPPDNLNPDTVRTFIDTTYEAYKQEVGEQFGTTIRGVFTDEPSIHDRHCRFTEGRGWIPWTWTFPSFFQERRGYDLLDIVPYMYFNGEYSSQARHDYWRTITERFSEAYSKQLGDWCDDNGIAFTGHYLWENNMGTATRVCGAVMPNYRFQQVPGIDMLNEQTNEYITVKQCTSVANQYGRKFVLTETYGCTGWGFTFEGQRWIGDFQYVLGVNMRSQHLALYSIKGCRKRDYPPVFSYNTSWWKYNYVVEDYFARLSAVLTEGTPVRDILVLHPSSTAWSMVGTGPYGFPARGKDRDVSATNTFGHEFNAFLGELLKGHYDYDLGDETIMAETGAIQGSKLAVNLVAYSVVVIPPIKTMLHSTYRLLLDFLDAGGKIIAVGERASMLEGRPTDLLSRLYEHPNLTQAQDAQETIGALLHISPRRVSVTHAGSKEEAPEFLYMLREMDDCRTLFVVNNDRKGSHRVQIKMEGSGCLEEWAALTGSTQPVAAAVNDGYVHFAAEFGPAESRLYILDKNKASICENDSMTGSIEIIEGIGPNTVEDCESMLELETVSGFTRTMPNVLTLDTCSYRLNEQDWSEEVDVWLAQKEIRDVLGMRQVYGNGLEQRYKWINKPHPGNGAPVQLKFSFHIAALPQEQVHLVVESAEYYEITMNGAAVLNQPDGWFLDRSFDKIPLPGLMEGRNELVLSCSYHNRMEVEDIYIIGDFGVDLDRKIVAEQETLELGDWCTQGYFHYCGSMIYHFNLPGQNAAEAKTRTLLELQGYSAVMVEVKVNGHLAGHVPWRAANLLDLAEHLQDGENRIDIEVMGSPRNMLGPFHHRSGEPSTTSWASFRKTGSDYTPEYRLLPYGLFDPIKLYRLNVETEVRA
ncbi:MULTISPECIES: glycosyl hydrolase [unclassified Paenibacillus]|uniref:glycosyl hydrolase n=1 Tax=unclassified Paenibacillus TaxID=185978 RepID=UPI003641A4FA